jgi:uncharacterized protein
MEPTKLSLTSLGDPLSAALFKPSGAPPFPALVICHGALEYKEHFFELGEYLAERGVLSLIPDMHGHGESGGERFHVDMTEWVPDVQAALASLETLTEVDTVRIGAFGFSSGGTAVFEAAIIDPRIKFLIGLDATVRDSMSPSEAVVFKTLNAFGVIKRAITGKELRLSLAKMAETLRVASDPQVNEEITKDPRLIEAYSSYPLPGAYQCFFVDTLTRVGKITVPTLVMHGEQDKLDPPETARLLFAALTCEKRLEILPGSGHVGIKDIQKQRVMELTAEWVLSH